MPDREEPDLKPAWERMTRSTLYMNPGEPPELLDPREMYRPAFLEEEERREEEEPSPPNLKTDHDLYTRAISEYNRDAELYTDVLNSNRDISFAQTKAFGR